MVNNDDDKDWTLVYIIIIVHKENLFLIWHTLKKSTHNTLQITFSIFSIHRIDDLSATTMCLAQHSNIIPPSKFYKFNSQWDFYNI